MKTKFIETCHEGGTGNYGKFCVGRFDREEWSRPSVIAPEFGSLLGQRGWTPSHIWVMDLQTGEGAWFLPGGSAHWDLKKHAIWVCVLYEPFLKWLYRQDLSDLDALPDKVEFTMEEAPFGLSGYRREGPDP